MEHLAERGISMEAVRDLLKTSLGKTLEGTTEADKLEVAWSVACGKALAKHGTLVGFADGLLLIEVAHEHWLRQLIFMKEQLAADMSRIAKVPVQQIHFRLKGKESAVNE